MSPLRHRSVFGAKSAQNGQLRKVRFFVSDVKCGAWASKFARFRSKSGSRRSPCSGFRFLPRKACKFQPAELVTVCLRFVTARFWVEKVRKSGPVRELVLRRVFRGPTARRGPGSEDSPLRFRPAARQPAELVTTDVTAPSGSVFGAKSAQNGQLRRVRFSCQTASGMPEPQVSLVFGRKQVILLRIPLSARKTGEFHPAELVTARHRFVTALLCAKAAKFPRGLRSWQV